jgi:hypothetical protein
MDRVGQGGRDDWNRRRRLFRCDRCVYPASEDDRGLQSNDLLRDGRQPLDAALGEPRDNVEV